MANAPHGGAASPRRFVHTVAPLACGGWAGIDTVEETAKIVDQPGWLPKGRAGLGAAVADVHLYPLGYVAGAPKCREAWWKPGKPRSVLKGPEDW